MQGLRLSTEAVWLVRPEVAGGIIVELHNLQALIR